MPGQGFIEGKPWFKAGLPVFGSGEGCGGEPSEPPISCADWLADKFPANISFQFIGPLNQGDCASYFDNVFIGPETCYSLAYSFALTAPPAITFYQESLGGLCTSLGNALYSWRVFGQVSCNDTFQHIQTVVTIETAVHQNNATPGTEFSNLLSSLGFDFSIPWPEWELGKVWNLDSSGFGAGRQIEASHEPITPERGLSCYPSTDGADYTLSFVLS